MLLRRPHDLASLFRAARARSGWSQSELANKIGVSRQWVSLVETGKTSVEFDLVMGALQALGYRLSAEPEHQSKSNEAVQLGHVQHPTTTPPERTPLTRHGKPLGKQRTRRIPKKSDQTENPRG